jgi:uncharacterized protein YxeA
MVSKALVIGVIALAIAVILALYVLSSLLGTQHGYAPTSTAQGKNLSAYNSSGYNQSGYNKSGYNSSVTVVKKGGPV